MIVKGLSITGEHFTHHSGTVQKAEGAICEESRESLTRGFLCPFQLFPRVNSQKVIPLWYLELAAELGNVIQVELVSKTWRMRTRLRGVWRAAEDVCEVVKVKSEWQWRCQDTGCQDHKGNTRERWMCLEVSQERVCVCSGDRMPSSSLHRYLHTRTHMHTCTCTHAHAHTHK